MTLRDAKGTLKERWTFGTQEGRRSKERGQDGDVTGRRRDGHGNGTKTLSC
jgi:hypothetical protein